MESPFVRWGDAIVAALQNFVNVVASVLPDIIAAIVVLIIGLILAGLLGRLTRRIISVSKLDVLLNKTVRIEKLKESGVEIKASSILGWAVKWFFIIVTFIAVADILKLEQLTTFFKIVALYVPNVIIAILILLCGVLIGGWLKEMIVKAVEASTLPKTLAGQLGTIARIAVIVFSIMAAMTQLRIASDLINIMLTGFVAMVALAGGLSFGLGAKDHVRAWLDKIHKN